ncbi:MAG: hypothetical protein EXX96DRAFT_556821 [Benjaminiella poitrasii]|nr:MAG: hypothetical protein EXX96DRAFT_556821 [Benjaminiella poitrasii]
MKHLSLLPSEILDLIVSNILNDVKKYHCLHVCRNWYRALRPSLYRNIHLTSRRQLVQFLKCIKQSEDLYIYVRHLYIQDDVGLSQNEIEALPCLFPLLETLYFDPKLWKYQHPYHAAKNKWKRIKTLPPFDCYPLSYPLLHEFGYALEDLSLTGGIVNPLHRTKAPGKGMSALLDLFTLTPRLKRLTMHGRDPLNATSRQAAERTELTLNDITLLHSLLPHLGHLKLIDFALSIMQFEQTPIIVPASSMRKLDIENSCLTHYIWIESIAELYPNLTDLNLNSIWDPSYKQTLTWRDMGPIQEGFHRIATHCSSLGSVNLGQLESILRTTTESKFFDSLSKVTSGLVALDNTCLDRNISGKSATTSFTTFMACTNPEKTKVLRVQLWRDLGKLENAMKVIGLCTRLTELELNCGRYSYSWNYGCDVEVIANYCPRLEKLNLTMARLTSSKKEEGAATPVSNIKSICLNQIHFTTEAINVLSRCCPQLEYLELTKCVKDKDASAHQILLSLPHQHLKTLKIDHIYLRPSQYVQKCNIDAAMLAVNYSDRNQHDVQRNSPSLNTRWYHLCCQKSKTNATKHVRQLRRLGYLKSEKVKNYIMKYKDWDYLEENSIRGTYRAFNFWDSDIPYGYVQIDCKRVDTLIFNKVTL